MKLIGIDIGTTSIEGVLIDSDSNNPIASCSITHNAGLASPEQDINIQDPEKLLQTVEKVRTQLYQEATASEAVENPLPVSGMCLTGQVHGILYYDEYGKSTSPLYTWQDRRGRNRSALSAKGETWSAWASTITHKKLSSGYGFLTHLINDYHGLVPPETAGITTIIGYIGMRLAGNTTAYIDPTDAHSLGAFDLQTGGFDSEALSQLRVPENFLPKILETGASIGKSRDKIPVFCGLGDNQAGFIGSVMHPESSLLMNIGTSAQVSVYLDQNSELLKQVQISNDQKLEVRPFPEGGLLLTGAVLCGGSVYAYLENLFREICMRYTGRDPGPIMDRFSQVPLDKLNNATGLRINTQFRGTRSNPESQGSITSIGPDNFTHDNLIIGFTEGVVDELRRYFNDIPDTIRRGITSIIAVGNAVRKNELLRYAISSGLNLPISVSAHKEAAAIGAAIVAGVSAGAFTSVNSMDRPIKYQKDNTNNSSTNVKKEL